MPERLRYDEYAEQNAAREAANRKLKEELKAEKKKLDEERRTVDERQREAVLAKPRRSWCPLTVVAMTIRDMYEDAMTEATKLGLMTKNSEATDRCQCTACGEIFSTVGNFDRHRGGSDCRPPAEVGLVQHVRGWWLQPGGDPLRHPSRARPRRWEPRKPLRG
jgi:hypothetical protein